MSKTQAIVKAVQSVLAVYRAQGYFPSAVVRVFTPTETLCVAEIGDAGQGTVFDVAEMHSKFKQDAPSAQFIFGTGNFGRDVFGRIVYGVLVRWSSALSLSA